MKRYLVVANQTLGGRHLLDTLRERCQAGPCQVHILVPASVDPRSWSSHDNVSDHLAARRRLDTALARCEGLGAEVTGEVGDYRVLDAIGDALRQGSYDEIVLSTLPPGLSRWLGMDLVRRVERSVRIPVTHVIGTAEPAAH